MNFNSLEELYKKVFPALEIRSKELNHIFSEKEIWTYLAKNKWSNAVDLSLSQIIDDILKFDARKEDVYES